MLNDERQKDERKQAIHRSAFPVQHQADCCPLLNPKAVHYIVRPCQTLRELEGCVSLQRKIWGYAEHELYPKRLFVTLRRVGGHILGAFSPDGKLVGFVASMLARREGRLYYHSLSLGVLPEHEGRGVGLALKLAQRRVALRAGIDLIEWTFDPLQAKNAFFNIVRLGAISRRYLPDYYGRVESRLQQGLPSDRLVAEWWLKSPRVLRALRGESPRPADRKPRAEVPIPAEAERVVGADPSLARSVQAAVRKQLQKCFARKWVIADFLREGPTPRYLLDPVRAAGLPSRKGRG